MMMIASVASYVLRRTHPQVPAFGRFFDVTMKTHHGKCGVSSVKSQNGWRCQSFHRNNGVGHTGSPQNFPNSRLSLCRQWQKKEVLTFRTEECDHMWSYRQLGRSVCYTWYPSELAFEVSQQESVMFFCAGQLEEVWTRLAVLTISESFHDLIYVYIIYGSMFHIVPP